MFKIIKYKNNKNWLSKVLAAFFAGAFLSCGILAVMGKIFHINGDPRTISAQFLMWLTAASWVIIFDICFLFSSGRKAWSVLGGLGAILWVLFIILRTRTP